MSDDITTIARAVIGDTAPFEEAQEFLQRFESALRRGIPERALLTVLHGEATKGEAWDAALRWLAGRGLYVLSGPLGTGKTVAAVRWSATTKATWVLASDAWVAERQLELETAPALVIDEIGGPGSVGELQTQRIGALTHKRHGLRRPTLWTTNFSRADIGQLFDGSAERSRLLDRIDEDGAFVVVRQRMRAKNTQPSTKRVDEARALVQLWGQVESIARGNSDDEGAVAELQRLLGIDEARLATALEQQRKISEMMTTTAARFAAMAREDAT
jgi:hypothetical protein